MIELSMLSLLLLGELVLVLVIAVVALLVGNARRRRRDRQAAMHLVGVIKENEPRRLAEAKELLEKRYNYSGDKLEQTAHDLNKAEKLLYQRILNTYVKRDVASLRQLNIHLEGMTDAYRGLDVPEDGVAAGPVAGPEDGSSAADDLVARLKSENATLKQELQITMETMGRMLSEYAAMFGGGPEAQMDKAQMMGMLEAEETSAEQDEGTDEATIEELEIPDEDGGGPETLEELLGTGAEEALIEVGTTEEGGDEQAEEADAADKTVLLEPRPAAAEAAGEIDLATDFDALLSDVEPEQPADEVADPGTSDTELDDIWAEALAEQEEVEKAAKREADSD